MRRQLISLVFVLIFCGSADTLKLSLDSCLAIARRYSPYRGEEIYHRRQVLAKSATAVKPILPAPFFNLTYSLTSKIENKSYTGQIGINQTLFSVEALSGLIGIGSLIQSEKASARLSRAKLAYLTTTAYYQLFKMQEIYRVKREEAAKRESLFRANEVMFRLNRIARLDLLRSESDFYQAKMEADDAQKELLLSQENLKKVLGWERDDFLIAQESLPPPVIETLPFSQFLQELKKKNPELRSVAAEEDFARLSYYSAFFSFLPSISLSLSSNYSDSLSFPKGLSEWKEKGFSRLSLSLHFPFLDLPGYSLSLLSKSQDRHWRELLRRNTWFSLLTEARDAYLSLRSKYLRYLYARKNWELAQELLRFGEEERRLGKISYLDFLDIETKYHNAYELYLSSIVEIKEAAAKIEYLLGGEE